VSIMTEHHEKNSHYIMKTNLVNFEIFFLDSQSSNVFGHLSLLSKSWTVIEF